MTESVYSYLQDAQANLHALVNQGEVIEGIADRIVQAFRDGHKVVIFGNGGSAADSQHFAAELVGRFERERTGYPAIALTVDTSALTAIANDYGYDRIFARQVEALVRKGDVAVGISTSGNSISVLEGLQTARKLGAVTIGFSGESGGKIKVQTDLCLCVPSKRTCHIQEAHIAAIHAICSRVEQALTESR